MTKQEFFDLASAGTVLLDGATGSNLRAAGMPVGVCPEKWILENPQILLDLQRAYVDAGSRILCTPTFSANRLSLRNFGLEEKVGELNAALTALTKLAAEGRALTAGDLSTMGRPLEDSGAVTYALAYDVYREQMEALAAAGVDLLAVETLMGVDEAAAALAGRGHQKGRGVRPGGRSGGAGRGGGAESGGPLLLLRGGGRRGAFRG